MLSDHLEVGPDQPGRLAPANATDFLTMASTRERNKHMLEVSPGVHRLVLWQASPAHVRVRYADVPTLATPRLFFHGGAHGRLNLRCREAHKTSRLQVRALDLQTSMHEATLGAMLEKARMLLEAPAVSGVH